MNCLVSRSLVLSLCLLLPLFAMTGACSRAPTVQYAETLPATVTEEQSEVALPVGFITFFEPHVTWAEAAAYCRQHGGRLPRINNSDSWAWPAKHQANHIDGFGARGAPWPSTLPRGHYWTGTVVADLPDYSWVVSDVGGWVSVLSDLQSTTARVACIPQTK